MVNKILSPETKDNFLDRKKVSLEIDHSFAYLRNNKENFESDI